MKSFYNVLLIALCSATFSHGQTDSLTVAKPKIKDSLVIEQALPKTIKRIPAIDSLAPHTLLDNAFAKEIDEKWKNELYNSPLYDTIYKTVSELKYDEVDYLSLPTDTLKARLKQLDAKTPFNIAYNPALESVIKQYLKRRSRYFGKLLALSQFYFPMFERELDSYNIPLEIKYLAVVESALKIRAKSPVGATGLWQFMFSTGKIYGLDVNSYVDERNDPIKATKAACAYLSKLYSLFGDWDLALAAYNSGPGNVSKAIRRSGGYENYWNIRPHLPRETAGYLPAFLATMYLFEYANEHGIASNAPKMRLYDTDTLRVKQLITFDQIAEKIDIPVEELQFLNPSYKLDIIPVIKGKDYVLRLPKDKIGIFVNNEAKIYAAAQAEIAKREKPLPKFTTVQDRIRYRVKPGDYLGKIARKYRVGVSQIKRWNGLRSDRLKVGQRLTIHPRR